MGALDAIHHGAHGVERRRLRRLFAQLEHQRQLRGHRGQELFPLDRAFVGQQVLVFFGAVIIVNVRGCGEFAHHIETRKRFAFEVRVAGVKAQLQARQARVFEEVAQVRGSGHFAGRVFEGQRDTTLAREHVQVLERSERRIPMPAVVRVARSTDVQHHQRKRHGLGHVQRALDLVDRIEPPRRFGIADGNRCAALARRAEVALVGA